MNVRQTDKQLEMKPEYNITNNYLLWTFLDDEIENYGIGNETKITCEKFLKKITKLNVMCKTKSYTV